MSFPEYELHTTKDQKKKNYHYKIIKNKNSHLLTPYQIYIYLKIKIKVFVVWKYFGSHFIVIFITWGLRICQRIGF